MRILHTSDWHLGRSFHREGLLDAQSAFVDHLVDVVAAERVDLVVVSGDVFDRALPSVDAVQVGNDALRRLLDARVRVVITSGNHDSGPRLGFAADLIDAAGIHLRADPASVGTPVIVDDRHGPVAVYGLPYLEPDLTRDGWGIEQRSHQAVLDEAVRRVHADLEHRPGARSVVLAHAFVAGARPSDSERDISVGGVASVAPDTFAGIDYVALGHLHGRHTIDERMRYSGSPLAYSFSESAQLKGSWLVDLDEAGFTSAEFVPAPVPRPLATLRGELDELLTDRRYSDRVDHWLQITLTDAVRPPHALDRLRQRFPHTLVVGFDRPLRPDMSATIQVPAAGRLDLDIVADFFVATRGVAPTPDELVLLGDACDACRVEEDAAAV